MDPTSVNLSAPALTAPAGQTVDLVDPVAPEKVGFIISAAVCLGISSLLVLLRFFTKARVLKEFLLEDYAILFAWLGTGAWYGLNFATSANGLHQWDVTMGELSTYLKYINAILILYCPLAFLAKLSILIQMQSIFTRQRNHVWYLCQISIFVNLIFYIALLFLSIFQCVPRERIWQPLLDHGTCIPLSSLLIPPAAIVALSDIWILTLPVIVLWRLHIPFARKVAITASFGIGLVSLVAAVMPLYYSVRFMRTDDETYAVYPIAMWAGVQLCTLVTAAAIPVLPKLWAHVRGEGITPTSYVKNSALDRIASFRRRKRGRRDTLEFRVPTPERRDLAALGRPETPYEIVKTTEVRVTSFRLEPSDVIGQAV